MPATLDLASWPSLEPLYQQLLNRPLATGPDIDQWLFDWSELAAVVGEESARRYIAMTCATEDKELERAYMQIVEEVDPQVKTISDKLAQKLLAAVDAIGHHPAHYAVLLRSLRNAVELFRAENVPLETELEKLAQQYQKIVGAMMVSFRGEERTLQQMDLFLEEKDRAVRQQAWELSARRRLQDAEALEDLYDKMLALRASVARNAGFANFRDYLFRHNERFDYTPEDCFRFHESVETLVVPVLRELLEQRRQALGVDRLRPWDVACDRYGRAPLRPFDSTVRLAAGCHEIFQCVDSELAAEFQEMIDRGLLDLASRKGKAPGGYQYDLTEVRLPFIFMNAVGTGDDIYTLLHEGGHAFHLFAARHQPLIHYRQAPIEFCEVASMGMEQLASDHLGVFYSPPDAARARLENFIDIITFLPYCATIDAFQHWVYTHEGHTREERAAAWLDLVKRFSPVIDYSGYEDMQRYRWQAKLHVYLYPFYYIEYGIAQLGALQLWANSRADYTGTIKAYKQALALGGSQPLPTLFETAGIRFDFSAQMIRPTIAAVQAEAWRLATVESGA